MKRGVVMSIHKQHAVVMTADGQFLRAPLSSTPQIGEEITFEEEYKQARHFKSVHWYSGAAAVVLLMLIPLLLFVQRDAHPVVAYLSMDINPSIEIGVDKDEKVRELHALNEDGRLLVENLPYKGLHVEAVAAAILEQARGSHYLDTPNKDIFITSVLLKDTTELKRDYEKMLAEKVDQTLRALLAELASEAASANVTTLSVPNELRDVAAANGISSGKMAVYLMAKEEGYKLELEQIKQQSIDKVTEPIGGVQTIVENASDTSKEKLKELVAKEQRENAKKQKEDKKTNAIKPANTPNASKSEKPVKTDNPDKNGEWDKNPASSPEGAKKPAVTSKPKGDKKDDKDDDDRDDDDRKNDKDINKDNNKDRNRSNDDDDDDRNDGRNDNDQSDKRGSRDNEDQDDKRKDDKRQGWSRDRDQRNISDDEDSRENRR
ncbi:anti-sigma factor domain-containing protein [Paenibacillus sp. sgz302251]|uniref:anti-sigma factor domain-containing protein n=1 Tax=Paenibacillus sp. sgz302251 TaxID=3414493 RepID=UPI003C7BCB7D